MPNNTTNHSSNADRYSRPFFEVFLLSIIIVWLPVKLLAYLVPFLSIAWFVIRANSGKTLLSFIYYFLIFVLIVCCYVLFYFIVGEEFIIQNSFLFFLTYGSFLFFLVLPANAGFHRIDYSKYMKVIRIFILIESLLGICQLSINLLLSGGNLDSGAGDVVQGTLNPLSFLDSGGNFNNQIYTGNLIVLLLFYFPYAFYYKKGMWICVLGLIAVMLASVLHLFIAFLFAILLVAIYFGRSVMKFNFTRLLIVSFAALCLFFLSITIQPKNIGLISSYLHKVTSTKSSPKAFVTYNSFTKLPKVYPWVYLIGLGPGQYSSRAGLIGTGKYFGKFTNPKKIPFLSKGSSNAFREYIYPKWEEVAINVKTYGDSTMSRPFYSILSMIIEFGYIIFTILILLAMSFVIKIKKLYTKALAEKKSIKPFFAFSCAVSILYLFLISFFENYLEVTQAIFPGLLMLKYFYTYIKNVDFA